MRTVRILSGPSGCGKSTLCEKWKKEAESDNVRFVRVSADDYFIDRITGEYNFDPSNLPIAHSYCMNRFLSMMGETSDSDRLLVVDNTNIHSWERQNYGTAAYVAGWAVEVHAFRAETVDQIKLCASRNQHGTPVSAIAKMAIEHEIFDASNVFYHQIENEPRVKETIQ